VNERLMAAADVKDVMWGSSMNTVTIYNNGEVAAPFKQDWDDQIVLSLGLAYQFSDAFTGRIGYNHGKNPIPDQNVNYLWPAIMEDHYTVGFGFAFNKQSEVNFSLSVAPEVTVSNGPMQIDHSQVNWQLMYSHGREGERPGASCARPFLAGHCVCWLSPGARLFARLRGRFVQPARQPPPHGLVGGVVI
jgi:hypothetical protein